MERTVKKWWPSQENRWESWILHHRHLCCCCLQSRTVGDYYLRAHFASLRFAGMEWSIFFWSLITFLVSTGWSHVPPMGLPNWSLNINYLFLLECAHFLLGLRINSCSNCWSHHRQTVTQLQRWIQVTAVTLSCMFNSITETMIVLKLYWYSNYRYERWREIERERASLCSLCTISPCSKKHTLTEINTRTVTKL